MERRLAMPIGIVVEKRSLTSRWQPFAWKPVDVIPGAAPIETPRELAAGKGWVRYHMATLPLMLHRSDTLAYKTNLSNRQPVLYVTLRTDGAGLAATDVTPFQITASPFEAQDHLDAGDDIVEGVPMPDALIAWINGFCDHHHVDQPFKKRKRDPYDPRKAGFARRPLPGTDRHGN